MHLRMMIVWATMLFAWGPAGPQASAVPPHPDFSGVWRLDLEASTPLDAMLKLQGVSSFKRRMMRKTVVTQTIEQAGNNLTIHVDSKHQHAVEHLIPDGKPRPSTTPQGEPIVLNCFWSTDGRTLVSIANVTLKDGRAATLETRRTLDASRTSLLMTVILRTEDGVKLQALRVFRKKETGGAP